MQRDLSNLQRFVPRKLGETGVPGSVTVRIYKKYARSIATIVAKSRTGSYCVQRCAQQRKMRFKSPRYPVTPHNSSATCNATVLR